MPVPWKKSYDKPRHHIEKQRHPSAYKGPYSQRHRFNSGHVLMWRLDGNEGWASKNWCFQVVMLEKTLESPLDYKEIKPVNPKISQFWIFIGRTDAEAEAQIFWLPYARPNSLEMSVLLGKIEQEEKGVTEDRWLDDITNSINMDLSKLWETMKDKESSCVAVHSIWKCQTALSN